MPTALGGKGGGVTTDEELIQWVKNRLENFPTLPDLSSVVSTDTSTDASTVAGAGGAENDLKKVLDINIADNSETETVSESGTVIETIKENTVSL